MPLTRLIAEGVGPFDRLELDLSDGNGNAHLGPHILAGVNGSGKSTVLRTIGWVLDEARCGFDHEQWGHSISGHHARALVLFGPGLEPFSLVVDPYGDGTAWPALEYRRLGVRQQTSGYDPFVESFNIAAYAPAMRLSYLHSPDLSKTLESAFDNSLAFQSTIQNEALQAWLLSLYSKRAIARERKQPVEDYTRGLYRFERALELLYGEDVRFEVEIEPRFQPRLHFRNQSLNFSQLPDGVRATVGWIADFMMRQDLVQWHKSLNGRRPGILLLDEVDAHLHPLWQRTLLPAIRTALPDVQIIVTSHSPFVISSCRGARVHVFELDQNGRARNRPPVDSPIGESVQTTLKDIFGVDSRFDIQTERELDEWNKLKKDEVSGKLNESGMERLVELTTILSDRSEELRSIVASPLTIPKSVLDALVSQGSRE